MLDGHFNLPLNAVGHGQAAEAGKALKDVKFAAAYASDLHRAFHTAKGIVEVCSPQEYWVDHRPLLC